MRARINGPGQIEAFLRDHAGMTFCGPLLLGESLTPLGAKLHFPALRLRPGHELGADACQETRIVGSTPFAWHARGRFEVLLLTNIKEIDGRSVCETMFEPMLLYLALLAGSDPNSDGVISQSWLAGREFVLNIGHCGGIQTWTYPAGDITATEALRYLVDLTRDFLDPTSFDLLPFEAIVRSRTLKLALMEGVAAQMGAETFRSMLEEYLSDQRENPQPGQDSALGRDGARAAYRPTLWPRCDAAFRCWTGARRDCGINPQFANANRTRCRRARSSKLRALMI